MLYFVNHGVGTNAKNEKNGYLIQMRKSTVNYISKEFPQLIVIVKHVKRKENKMDNWKCRFQQEPIDNKPHFIVGGRGSGKTIRLIKEASETNGVIVCPTHKMSDYICHLAQKLNCKIREPITYEEAFGSYDDRKVSHYFDEYGIELWNVLRRKLSAFEHYKTKTIIIDENSVKSLNDILDGLKVTDMDGRELRFKIEVLGRNESND